MKPKRTATYEDLMKVPYTMVAEIVDGELITNPRPAPSTARIDRSRKMRIYAREAVAHLWMVDPLTQTIEIYRRDGAHWLVAATYAGNTPLRAEPFAAVELDVARWWRRD